MERSLIAFLHRGAASRFIRQSPSRGIRAMFSLTATKECRFLAVLCFNHCIFPRRRKLDQRVNTHRLWKMLPNSLSKKSLGFTVWRREASACFPGRSGRGCPSNGRQELPTSLVSIYLKTLPYRGKASEISLSKYYMSAVISYSTGIKILDKD